jgi:hypothetical protein
MSRSYWLSIFAVVGWLTASIALAEESKPYDRKGQGTAGGEERQSKPFSFPVRVLEKPAQTEADIRQEQEATKRDVEDLAAQQAMADATKEIVWYTKLQLALAVLGTLALLYSIKLNRRATNAAVTANENALKTFVGENRPWIRIDTEIVSDLTFGEAHADLAIDVKAVNVGHSPAILANFHIKELHLFSENADDVVEALIKFKAENISKVSLAESRGETIFPNTSGTLMLPARIMKDTIDESTQDPNNPRVRFLDISFAVAVTYQSTMDDRIVFQTSEAIVVMGTDRIMKAVPFLSDPTPQTVPVEAMKITVYPKTREAT